MDELNAFERQLEREVHRAFGPPRPVDVVAIVRDAARSTTPTTQSRRKVRWWPFPDFDRREMTPAATHFQPSPIRATNGRSPIVIERTHSMFSPAKAIIAVALVFALGGVFVIGQPFGQPASVPGAALDTCATPIVAVEGIIIWGHDEDGADTTETREGRHVREYVHIARMAVDDDRLDGRTTGAIDWDVTLDEQGREVAGIAQGAFRIDGSEGTWEGTWSGVGWGGPVGPQEWQAVIDLVGTGAYEGLSARLFHQSADAAFASIEGSIYATDFAACDFSPED